MESVEKIEKLHPSCVPYAMRERIIELEKMIDTLKRENAELPEGKVYVSTAGGRTIVYLAAIPGSEVGDARNGGLRKKYVRKKQTYIVHQLAQQEYNEKAIAALEWELSFFRNYLKKEPKNGMSSLLQAKCSSKRPYYIPITIPDDEFIEKWNKVTYPQNDFHPENLIYATSFGLRVRSKSEVLIAEMLKKENIPFKYEYPVELQQKVVYPDFYCLNVRTRTVYLWEHFGMMDDDDYVDNALDKLADYMECGYIEGLNLICTREDLNHPLSVSEIVTRISVFLK